MKAVKKSVQAKATTRVATTRQPAAKPTTSKPDSGGSPALNVYDPAVMDAAAQAAADLLPKCKTALDLAEWLHQNYMKAGYKRLNRAIFAYYGLKNARKAE
jgi:hypothetical protein